MTELRIKVLKSKEQPVGLAIRIKRWFSRIGAWFQVSQAPAVRHPELQIRLLNNRPTTDQSSPSKDRRSGGPAHRGIVFNQGERKCKTCGGPLLNGEELADCSENPAHKIHALCVGLAGHKCPDCQAVLS